LGVPCVADRALQRSAAQVLSAIYEQDFLTCSFGGRPGRGAHQALASLHEVISGRKVEWVLEADLKNFFGSLSHDWMLRFVEHRIGDPRLMNLIRRWLKASVLEDARDNLLAHGCLAGDCSAALTLGILRSDSNRACGRSTLTRRISGRGPEMECCVVLVPV
jgi:RNA-directed DNA polymerase